MTPSPFLLIPPPSGDQDGFARVIDVESGEVLCTIDCE